MSSPEVAVDRLEDVGSVGRMVMVSCLVMVMMEGKMLWLAGRLQGEIGVSRTKTTRFQVVGRPTARINRGWPSNYLSANPDVLPSPCT